MTSIWPVSTGTGCCCWIGGRKAFDGPPEELPEGQLVERVYAAELIQLSHPQTALPQVAVQTLKNAWIGGPQGSMDFRSHELGYNAAP